MYGVRNKWQLWVGNGHPTLPGPMSAMRAFLPFIGSVGNGKIANFVEKTPTHGRSEFRLQIFSKDNSYQKPTSVPLRAVTAGFPELGATPSHQG